MVEEETGRPVSLPTLLGYFFGGCTISSFSWAITAPANKVINAAVFHKMDLLLERLSFIIIPRLLCER